jgi:hypothetical protein
MRVGKTALWMPYAALPDWKQQLLEVLEALRSFQAAAAS